METQHDSSSTLSSYSNAMAPPLGPTVSISLSLALERKPVDSGCNGKQTSRLVHRKLNGSWPFEASEPDATVDKLSSSWEFTAPNSCHHHQFASTFPQDRCHAVCAPTIVLLPTISHVWLAVALRKIFVFGDADTVVSAASHTPVSTCLHHTPVAPEPVSSFKTPPTARPPAPSLLFLSHQLHHQTPQSSAAPPWPYAQLRLSSTPSRRIKDTPHACDLFPSSLLRYSHP
ncbi:hypothetical protein EX30DRAFT_257576 [Ascodesmis nigricans]|uniref:Uncharacterized protein n=1 Tax=Ascodesmis nigricans TaxID=341454 RepID=A0A4S2MPN1_9PEZI|nr:hypothetical protein EX30DRAFT_257576 [Ascodesmis nigricans]